MSDSFVIVNPCARRTWGDLPGDERRRHCDVCHRDVHAIGRYTDEERRVLWRQARGRVCGLLPASPRILRPSRRQVLIGALLTLAAPLFAADGRVRILVKDPDGFPLPGAEVSLLDATDKVLETRTSDAAGAVVWTERRPGLHRFSVTLAGFESAIVTAVASTDGEPVIAVLRVGFIGEIVTVPERRRRWWWPFRR